MNAQQIAAAIAQFTNAQEREAACLNLAANGGAEAVAPLIARLNEAAPAAEFQRQAYAAYSLGLMGTVAVAAVPPMTALLARNQIHDGTRQHIVRALGSIAPGTVQADLGLDALRSQTTHPSHTVRRKAAEAIEQFFEE
ncbi:MAG: hypothetical protein K2R98_24375 [Gemmataceae bacterium]|nr:hypothetical protein [Gemmataceae bacterium]